MRAKKRGRPIDPHARRERTLVRSTPQELTAWETAAEAAGLTVGAWLWRVANKAARGDVRDSWSYREAQRIVSSLESEIARLKLKRPAK
jgi:hypothetical protein